MQYARGPGETRNDAYPHKKMEVLMKKWNWQYRWVTVATLVAVPLMVGGSSIACGGVDVDGGGDGGSGAGSSNAACVIGGCSSQLCVEAGGNGGVSTCEWREEYACYQQHGVCERGADNQCGWRATQELQDCVTAANNPMMTRTPASGACIRNSSDACTTDADCATGGCGGELCEGVGKGGVTTCECTAPQGVSCGCVNGTCSWWQ